MEDIAIKVEGLSKVYKIFDKPIDRLKESLNPFHKRYSKDFYALNGLSFEIKKGETVGIIGKNGAGKSTLLKLITGVLTPSCGEVKVNGRIASLLELGAGFNPEMTGIENVYMNGMLMGCEKHEMDQRLSSIIDFADIGDFINQPVKMYSSGMFARLAFAVNAFVEPDILIVDEALSVGDVAFQAKCITRMRQMIQSGVTVLFVTHDMSIVKSFCKKCIYLNEGSLKIEGPAEEIADVYLRESRDEMNQVNNAKNRSDFYNYFSKIKDKDEMSFKIDKDFEQRVKLFRQGNGNAKILGLAVIDMDGKILSNIDFNQQVIIRIYIKFYQKEKIGVGYHIRDDKNEEIIGSDLTLESDRLISGNENDQYIVDFITRVPLTEGKYNMTIVLSSPIDKEGNAAIFVDLIENAYFFNVYARKNRRIWNKVYLPVDYKLHYLGGGEKRKCACCQVVGDKYETLPNCFLEPLKKYCIKLPRPEMVNYEEYICSNCGAADRDRAYALWMKRELDTKTRIKMLDIAPSKSIAEFIKVNFPNITRKTADLMMPGVDYQVDIMNMHRIPDKEFDFFLCSHVLEHVEDDVKAMMELKRVLKDDGRGILVVPIDLDQDEIDEDPNCTDVAERWRRFGQDDHIRKYSKQGFLDRIKEAGLKVKEYGVDYFGEEAVKENALTDTAVVYVVSK